MKTKLLRKFYREFKWKKPLEIWAYSRWAGDPDRKYVRKFASTVNLWKDRSLTPGFHSPVPHSWVNGRPDENWIDIRRLQAFFWKYRRFSTFWRKHGHFNSKWLSPENILRREAAGGYNT